MFRVEILHTANCEGPDTWKQHQRTSGEETRPSRRLTTLVPRLKSCTRTHRKVHSWRPTCMYVLHPHTTRWRSSIFVIRKRENRKTADTVVMKKQHIYTTFPSKAIFNQNYVWWKWANGEKKNKKKMILHLMGEIVEATMTGSRWFLFLFTFLFSCSAEQQFRVHSLPGWLCHRFNMLIWLETVNVGWLLPVLQDTLQKLGTTTIHVERGRPPEVLSGPQNKTLLRPKGTVVSVLFVCQLW